MLFILCRLLMSGYLVSYHSSYSSKPTACCVLLGNLKKKESVRFDVPDRFLYVDQPATYVSYQCQKWKMQR